MTLQEKRVAACHRVDREATQAMEALGRMLSAAVELGLLDELRGVRDALHLLHGAATVKYNTLTGRKAN